MSEQPTAARPVFRFAPSPNGFLHLGHAASALINQRMARASGGRLLLRIEDIDTGRTRDEFVEAIGEDLAWLGVTFDEEPLRQSRHLPDYQKAADRLDALGLVYPCFAARAEILAAAHETGLRLDPDGAPVYPGLHRGLDPKEAERRKAGGEPYAMRLDMARAVALARERAGHAMSEQQLSWREMDAAGQVEMVFADPLAWGDIVLQRKDVPTSYHLSVVVDDARQGVTHVVRGKDLIHATAIHRLLQVLLDLPEPVYHHHDLVLDGNGLKLSKSDSATSLRSLREAGWTRGDVMAKLGFHDVA
ncbi:MAG: tRNA glutamyl-Q(34) synthetase GluQRS [Alphaproteobacteria bacterium]|nr:tRNA glutamyl-Q(34) synthetase GluQRS [Alphaproteobacteria bacterium]